MKKTLSFIMFIILLGYSGASYAQDDNFFTFGIKAGANLSSFRGFKHNGYATGDKAQVRFMAGITTDFSLSRQWAILSGLEYVKKSTNLDMKIPEIDAMAPYYNTCYLQMPIHFGYKLKTAEDSNVIFHLGPYFAYGTSGDVEWVNRDTQMPSIFYLFKEDAFSRFDYGMGIGINVDTKNFAINIGYDQGLKNIAKSDFSFPDKEYLDATGISVHTWSLYLTIGYKYRLGY